jgi:hypothetical protein
MSNNKPTGWKTRSTKAWQGKPAVPVDPATLAEDLELCDEAIEAYSGSEFAKSCRQWVVDGKALTDAQKKGLNNTINAAWDGELEDDE